MFTIEHEFDHTTVTLIDEAGGPDLCGDIAVIAYDDRVVVEQNDADAGSVVRVTFSLSQIADLAAALNLPEGSYRRPR